MRIARSFSLAVGGLLRHKLRAILAMLGLVIGVAVVLVMVAVGEGAKHEVLGQIERLGAHSLVVAPAEVVPVPGREVQSRRATTLLLSDSEAIHSECGAVVGVAPISSGTKRIKFGSLSTMATIIGTNLEYQEIRNAQVAQGRYFTLAESMSGSRVAVIGATVSKNLFPMQNPVGAQIRVGHVPFQVIGVLASKGTSADGSGDEDNQVLVPVKTAMRRVFNVDHLNQIYVKAASREVLPYAEAEITTLLRTRHDLDRFRKLNDFEIEDQVRALRAEMDAADSFTTMIAGIAGVSLFVGGIGILSIMLITIKERVGEIGLRMALGARPRDILAQFLSEALLLGAFGGVFGLALGLGIAFGIGELTEWATYVSPEWCVTALAASLVLGVFAGVVPALKAARLDPVVALRSE